MILSFLKTFKQFQFLLYRFSQLIWRAIIFACDYVFQINWVAKKIKT